MIIEINYFGTFVVNYTPVLKLCGLDRNVFKIQEIRMESGILDYDHWNKLLWHICSDLYPSSKIMRPGKEIVLKRRIELIYRYRPCDDDRDF